MNTKPKPQPSIPCSIRTRYQENRTKTEASGNNFGRRKKEQGDGFPRKAEEGMWGEEGGGLGLSHGARDGHRGGTGPSHIDNQVNGL